MNRVSLNKEYTNEKERNDYQLLQTFCITSNFFEGVSAVTAYPIDAIGERGKNRYNIELKDREYRHDDFYDWYLECDKFAELRRLSTGDTKPLYVNFFSDGYTMIWCVDAEKGGVDPGEPTKQRKMNPGTNTMEVTSVYHLPSSMAVIYDNNGRRVQ